MCGCVPVDAKTRLGLSIHTPASLTRPIAHYTSTFLSRAKKVLIIPLYLITHVVSVMVCAN